MENHAKLLLLPHCLNKDLMGVISTIGKERGYEVHVVRKTEEAFQILENSSPIERIVGVSCLDRSGKVNKYLLEKGLSDKFVPIYLEGNGCKDTYLDLEQVVLCL